MNRQRSRPLAEKLVRTCHQGGWAVGCLLVGLAMPPRLPAELASLPEPASSPSAPTPPREPSPRTAHLIPDLALELLWLEPGTFLMGNSPEERSNPAEGPQTKVTLTQGFWLGRTEVTQAQYQAITGSNPSSFQAVGPNAPVEHVSWIDAMKACALLTERERAAGRLPAGYEFTLPTEAQWEYACRAGTTGDYARDPASSAWFDLNSAGSTHPVATKAPNPWGLYDMAGNVLEWCFDWYGNYPGGAVTDPIGPKRGYYRIARGGSWRVEAQIGRSAARAGGSAARLDSTLGFRLALTATR